MLSTLTRIILLILLLLTITGCSISRVMRVEDRQLINVGTMIDELRDTRVVFLGERHDAPAHHKLQLDILKSLNTEGKPLAIGMEMFEGSSQRALDAWTNGKVPEDAFRKVYAYYWRNLPWELYRDILIFARDNRIPIVALNAPRQVVRKVALTGFASLSEEDRHQLPEGIDARVDDAYMDLIASDYAIHGRNGEAFRNLCEAQMLRNRVMARTITDYLLARPGAVMVVIAGGGHAREKGGIPAELKGIRYKIVLPPIPTMTSDNITTRDGDYLLEEPISWSEEML